MKYQTIIGLSLLPLLSKVAQRIALGQFKNYLTQKNRLTCRQSGNREHHSTETLSLLVGDHIFSTVDKKQIMAMVLIDLSKAFDSLCLSTLLRKLQYLGISNKGLLWFESYLTNKQRSKSTW